MKPSKIPKSAVHGTLSVAAVAFGVSKKAMSILKSEGCPAFYNGRVNGALIPEDRLAEIEAGLKGGNGPVNADMTAEEAKRRKTVEEVRKLSIANDAKEGLLCRRSQVAEAFQRIASRITEARTQSETRDPLKLVGKDLHGMREGIRSIWDEVGKALSQSAKEFDDI